MKDDLILRKTGDFNAIYKKGKSSGSKYVVVLYKPNGTGLTRKAFVASKKVGNSVMRNRARRLMRESYRLYEDRLPTGYDYVFTLKAKNGIPDFSDLSTDMGKCLARLNLLEGSSL